MAWFVYIGIALACTTSAVFMCSSKKSRKDANEKKGNPANASISERKDPSSVRVNIPDSDEHAQIAVVAPLEQEARRISPLKQSLNSYALSQSQTLVSNPEEIDITRSAQPNLIVFDETVSTSAALPRVSPSTSLSSIPFSSSSSARPILETQPAKTKLLPTTTNLILTYPRHEGSGIHGTNPYISTTTRPCIHCYHTQPKQDPAPRLSSAPILPRSLYQASSEQIKNSVSHSNANTDPNTRFVPERPSQPSAHRQYSASTERRPYDDTSIPPLPKRVPQQAVPGIDHTNPNTGPIKRLIPIRPDQYPAQGIKAHKNTCGHYSHCSPARGNTHKRPNVLAEECRRENKNESAAPTPIFVIHQPHPHHSQWRQSYNRHCTHENTMSSTKNEEVEEEEDSDEINENLDEEYEVDEEAVEDSFEDEGEHQCAKLDVRGLYVREAIAAVQVFLPAQDQKYIESGFRESHRFVLIVTGWGKLSPHNVPKLKPAVEDLFKSTTYKLKYQYQWTNAGEMEVDLIGRKREAELRKRSEKRMRERKKNNI